MKCYLELALLQKKSQINHFWTKFSMLTRAWILNPDKRLCQIILIFLEGIVFSTAHKYCPPPRHNDCSATDAGLSPWQRMIIGVDRGSSFPQARAANGGFTPKLPTGVFSTHSHQKKRELSNVVSMLGQRRRQWATIKTTLAQYLVFKASHLHM